MGADANNIGIAIEAAKAGFDEIQFDYVRLPDTTGLAYEMPWTEQNRVAAIDGFLTEARTALTPFNVFLAADVFGYVCWNPGGNWQAPTHPRWEFRGQAFLYKLYVSQEITGTAKTLTEEPAFLFLQQFLPELQKTLFPQNLSQIR